MPVAHYPPRIYLPRSAERCLWIEVTWDHLRRGRPPGSTSDNPVALAFRGLGFEEVFVTPALASVHDSGFVHHVFLTPPAARDWMALYDDGAPCRPATFIFPPG